MNTYAKRGDAWCIRSIVGGLAGTTVAVTKRNGQSKNVALGQQVAFEYGSYFYAIAEAAPQAPQTVGDLSGILAMFNRARTHLRHPAIVLEGVRVSVAGPRAQQPGSLTITTPERGPDGKRDWLGRVSLNGVYQPARGASPAIGETLRRFAADPAGVAAEYGRLHGACCFCRRALRDERSTAVGYGPDCADHYGLPWGTVAAAQPLQLATRADAFDGTADYQILARREERRAAYPRGAGPVEGEPFAA
jgi:hypothetical protein